jgi:hypothetical protein
VHPRPPAAAPAAGTGMATAGPSSHNYGLNVFSDSVISTALSARLYNNRHVAWPTGGDVRFPLRNGANATALSLAGLGMSEGGAASSVAGAPTALAAHGAGQTAAAQLQHQLPVAAYRTGAAVASKPLAAGSGGWGPALLVEDSALRAGLLAPISVKRFSAVARNLPTNNT